ncbi:PD-(D/E)XK nuclease family protein [Peptoniphilus mikwangii]|uniref:PD-(D/E)XK nuclease family protein n=1 Tax=Peptoniphilus mikwangii TaxID=1354300 RepID=UPI000403698A|nr:PD-(D/E)XK nuclease family protein [Peptoniphilus mikwangii]
MEKLKVIYKANLYAENVEIKEKILEYIRNGKQVFYILPTKASIHQYKKMYIEELGGISNLKFHTFDSLRRENNNKKIIDDPFRSYILKDIIQKGNYKLFKNYRGIINSVSKFILRARENLVSSDMITANNSLFSELKDIYVKYEQFLNEKNLTDLIEHVDLNDKNIDLIVIDGFYSFKEIELGLIKDFSDKINVIVNVPFFLSDLNFAEKMVNSLERIGFETKSFLEDKSIQDYINDLVRNNRVFLIEEENRLSEFKTVFKFLKSCLIENEKCDLVSLSKDMKNLKQVEMFENLTLNEETIYSKYPIIEEFLSLIEYLRVQSRKNILSRIKLKYFEITDSDEMEYEISKMSFRNLDELVGNTRTSVELDEKNLIEFYELLKKLKVNFEGRESFKYYSEKLEEYLETAELVSERVYASTRDEIILKRDRQNIRSIKLLLDKLKNYDVYFKKVSFGLYIDFLNSYLDMIAFDNTNEYAPSVMSMDKSLYLRFNNVFITDFNLEFPSYPSRDFIFNKTNNNELINMGFVIESDRQIYDRELLKLLKLISLSKTAYLCYAREDDSSVYKDLFKKIKIASSVEISTVEQLSLEIIDEIEENKVDENKIKLFNSFSNYNLLNEKIELENKRLLGNKEIILSGDALVSLRNLIDRRGFKVTDFDLYVKSPYTFLFERILKIEEMLRRQKDTYHIDIGNIYHHILERYFKKYPNELNETMLKAIIKSELIDELPVSGKYTALNSAKVDGIFSILKNFIELDLSLRDDFIPVGFEVPINIKLDKYQINGRIDRVDRKGDYKTLIDYKKSDYGVPTQKDMANKEAFQFPIYIMAEDKCSIVEAKYGVIKSAEYKSALRDEKYFGRKMMKIENFEFFIDELKQEVIRLCNEIYNGNFTTESVDNEMYIDIFRQVK